MLDKNKINTKERPLVIAIGSIANGSNLNAISSALQALAFTFSALRRGSKFAKFRRAADKRIPVNAQKIASGFTLNDIETRAN